MSPSIRRPLFEGTRMVRALWFDATLIGEPAARRRVLAHWEAGSRAYRVREGYLLDWPRARLLACARQDGMSLCEEHGVLSSAPLAADERAGLAPGCAVLVLDAQAQAHPLSLAARVDPSLWLDLDFLPLHKPLAMPVRQAGVLEAVMPPAPDDVRAILGSKIPPPSEARQAFLKRAGKAGARPSGAAAAGAMLAALPLGLLGALGMLFGKAAGRAGPARHGGLSPAAQKTNHWLARLAAFTRMSRLLGWRQADYLRKTMAMFDRGDLLEALRHAIPLDNGAPTSRQAFGVPRPRSGFDITGPDRTAPGIGLDASVQLFLRQTYRRSFERLDREGKIDEAVFVLAELLRCGAEAVDYLERKQRFKQAAQLAETMELAPEMAVRLWFLAGDSKRAVQLARLGRAFAPAVRKLEQSGHPQASLMRVLWAEDLAARGELAQAAAAIWPVAEARDRARDWLEVALRADGDLDLQALVRILALDDAALAAHAPSIDALLKAEGENGAERRARCASCLLQLEIHSAATGKLAGALLRVLLPETVAGGNRLNKDALGKLVDLAQDAVFKGDLPPLKFAELKAAPGLASRLAPLACALQERGLLPIHDARRLSDGHYILALGEGGVLRVNSSGKQLAHFPVPAHHLVPATSGQRLLALARRDGMMRVSRIDLAARKVSDWFSRPLSHWARQYDGVSWSVVMQNRLVALDTASDAAAALWQVADLPGEIAAFAEEGEVQTLLLRTPGHVEQWRYALPARRLVQRDSFPFSDEPILMLADCQRDAPMALSQVQADGIAAIQVARGGHTVRVQMPAPALASWQKAQLESGWLLLPNNDDTDGQWRCTVVDPGQGKNVATLTFPLARQAVVHAHDGHILAFDLAGRLLDLDCSAGTVHALTLS
jgi:hypothetical protein